MAYSKYMHFSTGPLTAYGSESVYGFVFSFVGFLLWVKRVLWDKGRKSK